MAAPRPLPPVVDGPITQLSTQVYVDSVLPNAAVTVYNDPAGTNQVGTITSGNSPGGIWVPLTKPVAVGQQITARQEYTGPDPKIKALVSGLSDPSNVPVPVEPAPNPLPPPVFISGLSTCMDFIWMDGLIPGAHLVVTAGATKVVDAPVTQSTQWFQLKPAPLTAKEVLVAVQSAAGFISSASVPSQPIAPAPGSLPPPVLLPPLIACQTSIQFQNMFPSADAVITQTGFSGFTTAPSQSFWASGFWPLKQGPIQCYQYLQCPSAAGGGQGQKITSPTATFTVGPPNPTVPDVTYPPCVDVTQLTVSNLIPGEILTLQRVVTPTGGGAPTVTPIGSQGVGGTTTPATLTVDLPKDFQATDPAGPVSIRLSTMLCDVTSGTKDIAIGNPGGPFTANVEPPLFECSRYVVVKGVHPGSLIQVFSGSTAHPRSNPVVATTPSFVVKLWTELVAGEQIFVVQTGCAAGGTSAPPVPVLKLPNPLPVPVITTPVLTDAKTVDVTSVLPGAQVFLYVGGVFRSEVGAVGPSVSLPVLSPPLTPQQRIQVTQQLCGKSTTLTDAGSGTTTAITPAPSPSGGLGSSANYIFWGGPKSGGGFIPLLGIVVTIDIKEDLIGTPPCSFQLNAYSPSGDTIDFWQQYGISMAPNSNQLNSFAENWPPSGNNLFNIEPAGFVNLPNQTTIPKGFKIVIQLVYSGSSINGSKVTVFDGSGTKLGEQDITLLGQPLAAGGTVTAVDLAPIVAFQLDLVGWANSVKTVFTSGAGTITYTATTLMIAQSNVPVDAEGFSTAEQANSIYGELPSDTRFTFVQSFTVTPDGHMLVVPHAAHGRISLKSGSS
jgi:hypothetical protein